MLTDTHMFGSFPKAYVATLWNQSKIITPSECSYGGHPDRRRVHPIVIQDVTRGRLTACGVSSCLDLLDATNAFASVAIEHLKVEVLERA